MTHLVGNGYLDSLNGPPVLLSFFSIYIKPLKRRKKEIQKEGMHTRWLVVEVRWRNTDLLLYEFVRHLHYLVILINKIAS